MIRSRTLNIRTLIRSIRSTITIRIGRLGNSHLGLIQFLTIFVLNRHLNNRIRLSIARNSHLDIPIIANLASSTRRISGTNRALRQRAIILILGQRHIRTRSARTITPSRTSLIRGRTSNLRTLILRISNPIIIAISFSANSCFSRASNISALMLVSLIDGLIADLNSYLLILGFLTRSTSNHATIFLLIQSNSQTSRQTLSTTSSQFSLTRIIHRNIHRSNFLTNLTSNIRNLTYRRRNRAAILVYLRVLRSTSTLILRISNPIIISIRLFDGNRRQNHPLEGIFPFSICQLDRNQVATWGHAASRRTQSNSAIRVNLRPGLSANFNLSLVHFLKQGGRNITGSSSRISSISRRLSAILLVNRCRYRGCLIQIDGRCFIFRRNFSSETVFRDRPVTGFLRVDRRRINLIFVKISRNR